MPIKYVYALGFFIVCVILGTSFYLQIHDGFQPCPLCTLQRLAFALLGVLFLLGVFLHRVAVLRLALPIASFITADLGMVVAGRQVYLQFFQHGSQESCGVSLEYMLQVLPLNEAFQKIFAGSAECTQRGFEFLYLNMAEWSFLAFVGFGLLSFYALEKSRKLLP